VVSVTLRFIVPKMLPPEADVIAGGKKGGAAALRELGPVTDR